MDHNYQDEQRWILFLFHARTCKLPCPDLNCGTFQALWSHMNSCVSPQFLFPGCRHTKELISHYENFKHLRCPVCVPVATYLQQQANVRALAGLKIESTTVDKALVSNHSSVQASDGADTSDLKLREDMRTLVFNMLQQLQPSPADAASKEKYMDVATGLEEGLYKMSISKEDYVNRSTLESRVTSLLRKLNCLGNSSNTVSPMEHTILKIREYMRNVVLIELQKWNPSPTDDASKAKYLDVARRLEEGIYKMSITMDDYLNLSTLESRLTSLLKGRNLNNYNQIQQNSNSSPPGTMTPTAPEHHRHIVIIVSELSDVPICWSLQESEKLPENGDQLETDITENLKSVSLYR